MAARRNTKTEGRVNQGRWKGKGKGKGKAQATATDRYTFRVNGCNDCKMTAMRREWPDLQRRYPDMIAQEGWNRRDRRDSE